MTQRVLLVAPNDGATNAYVRRAFQALGWEVVEYDYRAGVGGNGFQASLDRMEANNQELLRLAAKPPFDLVLILKGELVHPGTIQKIRRDGPPVALWHFDPREDHTGWLTQRAKEATAFFTIAKGSVDRYVKEGVNAHWLLEGADRDAHRPTLHHPVYKLSFVGTVHDVPGRAEWLNMVHRVVPVNLWGSYPCRGPIYRGRADGDQGLRDVVATSTINLGRDRNPEIEASYGARLFRTLSIGGFLLTNHTKGIERDFPGCVAVYEDDEDCVRLVEHYLEADAERAIIARRGQRLVRQKHLFEHRISELVKIMGL